MLFVIGALTLIAAVFTLMVLTVLYKGDTTKAPQPLRWFAFLGMVIGPLLMAISVLIWLWRNMP